MDVLVGQQGNAELGRELQAGLGASTQGLVDDNAIGGGGGDKGQAVRELGHAGVVVHAEPREGVAEDAENQGEVTVWSAGVSLKLEGDSRGGGESVACAGAVVARKRTR